MSSKPTQGPVVKFSNHCGIGVMLANGADIAHCHGFNSMRTRGEMEANAALIAEAFNTLHETGLTPQQLREQRDELLAAVKLALTVIGGNAARDALVAAIAKVEGRS